MSHIENIKFGLEQTPRFEEPVSARVLDRLLTRLSSPDQPSFIQLEKFPANESIRLHGDPGFITGVTHAMEFNDGKRDLHIGAVISYDLLNQTVSLTANLSEMDRKIVSHNPHEVQVFEIIDGEEQQIMNFDPYKKEDLDDDTADMRNIYLTVADVWSTGRSTKIDKGIQNDSENEGYLLTSTDAQHIFDALDGVLYEHKEPEKGVKGKLLNFSRFRRGK